MKAVFGPDQLCSDAHGIAGFSYRAFQDVFHTQRRANLAQVLVLALALLFDPGRIDVSGRYDTPTRSPP